MSRTMTLLTAIIFFSTFRVLVAEDVTSSISFTVDSRSGNDVQVDVGTNVLLQCLFSGNQETNLTIKKGSPGEALTGGSDQVTVSTVLKRLTVSKVVGCRDSDIYTCTSSNGNDDILQNQTTLWVKCLPELIETPTFSYSRGFYKGVFKLAVYPNPTGFLLYKNRIGSGSNRRDVTGGRMLVDQNLYIATFSRDVIQYGIVTVTWVDMDDDDDVSYTLDTIGSPTADPGNGIPFNLTKSKVQKASIAEASLDTYPPAGVHFIPMLTSSVIAVLIILGLLMFCITFLSRDKPTSVPSKARSNRERLGGRAHAYRQTRDVSSPFYTHDVKALRYIGDSWYP